MHHPQPTEAHRKLEKLAGVWTGEEKMHPSPWVPEGSTAQGRTSGRLGLNGFALIVEYEQRRDDQVTFTGHGVYTYDPKQACYVLYWFDCMGGQPNLFKGNFEGDTLTLTSDESSEGGPRYSRLVYDLSRAGHMSSRMEVAEDGVTFKVFMDATYIRQD